MEKLNNKIKWVWQLQGVILSTVLTGITGAGLLIVEQPVVYALGIFIVVEAVVGFYMYRRYANWGFQLESDYLYIEKGVLRKTYSNVPYVRVQHIDTSRGPFERLLGLSTVGVYTAGSKGADVGIPGLERERARNIQEELRGQTVESEKGFDAV
jgi:hypothetical protein